MLFKAWLVWVGLVKMDAEIVATSQNYQYPDGLAGDQRLLEGYSQEGGSDAYTLEYVLYQQQLQQAVMLGGHSKVDPATLGSQLQEGRQAEQALLSWGMGQEQIKNTSTTRLGFSMRASEYDLKEFLSSRGGISQLQGLHKSAALGDRAAIMSVMKREGPDAPLNELDHNGCTPLMYAAMADSVTTLEILLHFAAKREMIDHMGRTAVHYASMFGCPKALKFLIQSAADWMPRDVYGRTPLHWCIISRNTKCLQVLLKHGRVVLGNINPVDNEGMTPLMCTAQYNRPRHLQLMGEAECDFTAVDIEGRTALHWTAGNNDPGCIHAILDAYPPLLNQQDVNGLTVLHLAASKGSPSLVDTLLNINGIDKDARDNLDRTPLHYACIEGHNDVVQLLTDHLALDSCIDAHGWTALHYAVQVGSQRSTELLCSTVYTTHVPDSQGLTPLMLACQNNLPVVTKTLVANELIAASVNYIDSEGDTALLYACQAGSVGCVAALIDCGADPNMANKLEISPLFLVCEAGHHECVQPLVNGGAVVHSFNRDGDAPIHKAVLHSHTQTVEALLLSGCSTEITNQSLDTPLHLAAHTGLSEVAQLLLEKGANHSTMSSAGVTPLHIAAAKGHSDVLEVLLKFGAFPNLMDVTEERCTPMDYALKHNHSTCQELLERYNGIASTVVQTMAAISIQTAYRAYRAKLQLHNCNLKEEAVVILQRNVRGFLHRRRYQKIKQENHAAIKLQAAIRGFLQRKVFRSKLAKFREKQAQENLIEEFSEMIVRTQQFSLLGPLPIVLDALPVPRLSQKDEEEEKRRQQLVKLEACLRMRELYSKQQKLWGEFREAERKRRLDKARQEEMNRLTEILADSAARRQYWQERNQYTVEVKSHHYAATVIQRAYRRLRTRRIQLKEKEEIEYRRKMWCVNRAVKVIQRYWRKHVEWKKYMAQNFRSIKSFPVIRMQHHLGMATSLGTSYERGTLVSGSRRRQLHQTSKSGFKIFRPIPVPSTLPPITYPTIATPHFNAVKPHLPLQSALSPCMQRMHKTWPWFQQFAVMPPNHSPTKRNKSSDKVHTVLPPVILVDKSTPSNSHTHNSTFYLPKLSQYTLYSK